MRQLRCALIGIGLLLGATPSMAFTGNHLLKMYEEDSDLISLGFGMGYVAAIKTTWSYVGLFETCLDAKDVSNQKANEVVLKYLQDNPEDRHETASALIMEALIQAFGRASPPSDGVCK